MGRQKTKEEFIQDSLKIHGAGKFDYSLVDYKNSKIHVDVGCLICGNWFKQKPNHNLNGRGCPVCANQSRGPARWTAEVFISKAKEVHGEKYDYTDVCYRQYDSKVEIICKTHNSVFSQTPHMHLAGNGCPLCAANKLGKSRQEKACRDFVKDCHAVHGSNYDYSRANYKLSTEYVEIGCTRCGESFFQTPAGHKQGYGCPACSLIESGLKRRNSTEDFISKSKRLHGEGVFLYDKCDYTTTQTKLTIGCATCKNYWQTTPTHHFRGVGCASCADYGFKPDQSATLYVLQYENIVKVGITNRQTEIRVKEINKDSGHNFEIKLELPFDKGSDCSKKEGQLLHFLRSQYRNPVKKYNGSTESFLDVDFNKLLEEIKIDK